MTISQATKFSISSIARTLSVVTFFQLLIAFGGLVGIRLLTEFLAPEVFGQYRLFLSVVSLLTSIGSRPFIQYIMRAFHDHLEVPQSLAFLFLARKLFWLIALAVGVSVTIVMAWVSEVLEFTSGLLLLLVLFVAFLGAKIEFENGMLITRDRQIASSIISFLRSWLVPIAIAGLVYFSFQSLEIVLTATIIVYLFLIAIRASFFREYPNSNLNLRQHLEIDRHELVQFSMPLMMVGLFAWVLHESDRALLAYFNSVEVVGVYSAAYGLVSTPFLLLLGAVTQVLYPVMFRVTVQGGSGNRAEFVKGMLVVSIAICIPLLTIVWFFSDEIVRVALGPTYREQAAGLLFWVALGYSFMSISLSFDLAAFSEKNTTHILMAHCVAATTNVSVNLILIPQYGALGAVWATALSLFVYFIVMSFLYIRYASRPGTGEPSDWLGGGD
jgi:O-antigen/teichoic acid export membrane protein